MQVIQRKIQYLKISSLILGITENDIFKNLLDAQKHSIILMR